MGKIKEGDLFSCIGHCPLRHVFMLFLLRKIGNERSRNFIVCKGERSWRRSVDPGQLESLGALGGAAVKTMWRCWPKKDLKNFFPSCSRDLKALHTETRILDAPDFLWGLLQTESCRVSWKSQKMRIQTSLTAFPVQTPDKQDPT